MVSKLYTNLPIEKKSDSADITKQYFDEYFDSPIQIDHSAMQIFKGYFEKRGFDSSSAETIATVINAQAKRDGINPLTLLDSLDGLNGFEINGLITEILNYYRFKTSSLGLYVTPTSSDEVQRNILP